MGLIKADSHVDLDCDHQFIPAHKFDAKYSYKQDFGYFPGWTSIGGIIVGGENRDGNTNVKFHQEDTLRRIMDRVTSELGVVIERFRADCGSFSKEIIQTVEQRCNTFYIRAANCGSRCEDFRQLKEWKSVEVGYERCDVTSVSIDNLIEGKYIILVAMLATLVIKVCTKETASVVLSYWIKSYNITSPCILSCKMIEKVVVCQRSEFPVGIIRTFVLSLVAKFTIPFLVHKGW